MPGRRPGRALARHDLLPAYADHLHSLVDLTGIRRLTVVADAGNGMAGHTLPAVLGSVDLELIGLYTDPDGTFPNHAPNPLEPENLVDAQRARSSSTVPTWPWSSTAMPTAASSSTSGARWSAPRRSRP